MMVKKNLKIYLIGLMIILGLMLSSCVDPVVSDPVSDPVLDPVVPPILDPVSDPVVSDPVSDPVVSDPVVPPVLDPVVSDPVVSDPVVSDPVVSDPVVSDPVVSDPVVSDPVSPPVVLECVGDTSSSCVISNGVGVKYRTCAEGTWSNWGSCEVVSCNSGFDLVSGVCVAKPVLNYLFISPSGSDSAGDGTEQKPWKTLSYAVNKASFGDTVYLMPGTYTITNTVNVPRGVSLRGAGDTSVIKAGFLGEWVAILSLTSNPIANGDQSISFLKFDGMNSATLGVWLASRHNVTIYNSTFVNFMKSAVNIQSNGNWNNLNSPPPTFMRGTKFYNNEVHNSCRAKIEGGDSWTGALSIGGQEGMEIFNNNITCIGNPPGYNGWPITIGVHGGWAKDMKIYNNYLEKQDHYHWPFAIEAFRLSGTEIYNNRVIGTLDLNFVSKRTSDFGVKVYNNTIGPNQATADDWYGIYFEYESSDVHVFRNRFINTNVGISYTPRSNTVINNTYIYYNVFENVGAGSTKNSHAAIWVNPVQNDFKMENVHFYNNVFHAHPAQNQNAWFGFLLGHGNLRNINIVNNVVVGFAAGWAQFYNSANINGLYINNNIIHNNGNNNDISFSGGAPINYITQNNIYSNPLFVSTGNFRLQSGSPGRDAGVNVDLSNDFAGAFVPHNGVPDIGAYEYR